MESRHVHSQGKPGRTHDGFPLPGANGEKRHQTVQKAGDVVHPPPQLVEKPAVAIKLEQVFGL